MMLNIFVCLSIIYVLIFETLIYIHCLFEHVFKIIFWFKISIYYLANTFLTSSLLTLLISSESPWPPKCMYSFVNQGYI